MPADRPNLPDLVSRVKLRLLRMHFESGVGHIGGNLSALDLLVCLYHQILRPEDTFILSKGHAAGALYTTLWSTGALSEEDLRTFHKDATRLSGHPPPNGIPEIPFATGSLGHGVGLAAGVALGKKLKDAPGRVFCLTSDGEWNEGSSWEAIIFAVQQGLSNLVILVDANGLQGFGATSEVADLAPLAGKFREFNLQVEEIDGHNCAGICGALDRTAAGPRVVVARTVKGCGVSFMENKLEWHYLPMTESQYRQAEREVLEACATRSAGS
ncbi:MAG TPA: transketolase [Bryobacteraceae bacterium]|nr:transketolase [Bryobacteraceae bacterium]